MNNPEITVLMLVNNEEFIRETVDSIMKQSFMNWELAILNYLPLQKTKETINSYSDSRIRVQEIESDIVKNLNSTIYSSRSKYIAKINANDIMYSERFRIQLKRFEMNPEITVCASWIKLFETDSTNFLSLSNGSDFIDQPLIKMLASNIIDPATMLIDKSFLTQNNIRYRNYPFAEDYKLCADVAFCNGSFFIEPQFLSYKRICEINTVEKSFKEKQNMRIKKEIIQHLIKKHPHKDISDLYLCMNKMEKEKMIATEDIFQLFYKIFKNQIHEPQK